MSQVTDAISELRAEIQAEKTGVIAAAKLGFESLAAQIAALENPSTDADTAAQIRELSANLKANAGDLAAAIPAGVPAPAPAAGSSVRPIEPAPQPPENESSTHERVAVTGSGAAAENPGKVDGPVLIDQTTGQPIDSTLATPRAPIAGAAGIAQALGGTDALVTSGQGKTDGTPADQLGGRVDGAALLDGDLRTDGPTPAEYTAEGYSLDNYPPRGFAAKDEAGNLVRDESGNLVGTRRDVLDADKPAQVVDDLSNKSPADAINSGLVDGANDKPPII